MQMAEKGRSRADIAGAVAFVLVLGMLCLAFLNGCSASSVSEEDDVEEQAETAAVEETETAADEGTMTIASDWLSLEVPGNWTRGTTDVLDFEYDVVYCPDDYTGYVCISSTEEIDGTYEDFRVSVENAGADDGELVDEFTIDGAVVRRYEVDSGVEGVDGSYEGFVQFVYSGSEYKQVVALCLADEYDEHVEEMEEILDSMTLEDPAEPGSVAELAETMLTDDGVPISESLPYKGMDVAFIDETWLGEHDGEGDAVGGTGSKAGSIPYYWLADNGTGDKVFTAYVRDGKVIAVNRDNSSTDYWRSEDGSYDYPDLDASGERVDGDGDGGGDDDDDSSAHVTLEDPLDYDSPEEYADNAYKDFEALGSDDPWDDAYEYWEDNAA